MKYTTSNIKGLNLSSDAQDNLNYLEEEGYINEFENYIREQNAERELVSETEVSDLLEYHFDEVLEALGIPGPSSVLESLSKFDEDDEANDDNELHLYVTTKGAEKDETDAMWTIKKDENGKNALFHDDELQCSGLAEGDNKPIIDTILKNEHNTVIKIVDANDNVIYSNNDVLESLSKLVEDHDEDIMEIVRDYALQNGIDLRQLYNDAPDTFEFVENPPEAWEKMAQYVSEQIGHPVGAATIYDLVEEELDDEDDLDDDFDESLTEDAEGSRAEELKKLFQDAFSGGKMNCFETAQGVVYVEPQGEKLVYGGMTNTGIIPEYEFDYDFDQSFDWNLQGHIEQIMEKEGYPMEESHSIASKLNKLSE